ncbi:MAG TPA: lysyl oxidase family protein [Acidimicrobiales bacterium]|nr:lysyl oxidase family protein [Acidimicrobiales bacterium]
MRRIGVGAAVLLLGGLAPAVHAELTPPLGLPIPPLATDTKSIGTLDKRHPVLTFAGALDNPTPLPLVHSPVPVVCAVTCQSFSFTVTRARLFLVSVKDTAGSTSNGWDLSVYDPSGALAGAANGIGANGQAIAVTPTRTGTYTAFVTFTYAYDTGAKYNGEVRMMSGSSWQSGLVDCGLTVSGVRGCFRLPVLVADPAFDFHVGGLPPVASTPLGFPIPVTVPTATSCYVDETVQTGATRCLRFTSNVRNAGAARLDIRIPWLTTGPTSGFLPGQCQAEQAVQRTDGKVVMRPAGGCMFHPAHAHFHYKDLVGFSLHPLGANGAIGARLGTGLKESFCLADDDYFGFGHAAANGPNTYDGQPGCNLPASITSSSVIVEEGVSPGWGDVYTWDTPGQFIDISATPPGRYVLVERTNPSNTILVSGAPQLCSATELALTADAVTITRSRPSITCPP